MMNKKKILISAGIAALSAISFFYVGAVGSTEKKNDEPAPKPETGRISYPKNAPQLSSVKVASVDIVSMPLADAMNARLAYDETVTARVSSPVLGRVLSSAVEVGDSVAKNRALAEIDSPDLATAEADWSKAKADEQRKKLSYERSKLLFENEVLARKDMENAEADFRQAQAETQRSSLRMRNLNSVGNEKGQFALRAPIAGVITDKQINPGTEVRPDAPLPLFVISDLRRLWVLIDVPEKYLQSVKAGQKMTVELDAYPDQLFEATVDRIGLALDPNTRRIQVRGLIDNKENKLRPEMFARVAFLSESEQKVAKIPNTSLVSEGMYSYVYIEKKEGEFEKKRVTVIRKGVSYSYAEAAPLTGLRIVTEGALLLNAEVSAHAQ